MSASSVPISAHQFAEAIQDLPLANLHFKAAEIRNSIAHLVSSNQQMLPFAQDGDTDCREALEENGIVIQKMEERIRLLKQEVECRGFKWGEDEQKWEPEINRNGGNNEGHRSLISRRIDEQEPNQEIGVRGGRLDDEEIAQRIRERIAEDQDKDEVGLHL